MSQWRIWLALVIAAIKTEHLCPPKFTRWSLNSQCDGVWRSWEGIRSRGGAPWREFVPLGQSPRGLPLHQEWGRGQCTSGPDIWWLSRGGKFKLCSHPDTPRTELVIKAELCWGKESRCLRGASSARGKGHEEGGSAYAKAGSILRSLSGNSRASTRKTRVCLLSALCFHLHLWLYGGLSPTTSLWKKS